MFGEASQRANRGDMVFEIIQPGNLHQDEVIGTCGQRLAGRRSVAGRVGVEVNAVVNHLNAACRQSFVINQGLSDSFADTKQSIAF